MLLQGTFRTRVRSPAPPLNQQAELVDIRLCHALRHNRAFKIIQ